VGGGGAGVLGAFVAGDRLGAADAAVRLPDAAGLAPIAARLLPVWAGTLLGLFDDMVSGQPMGSAITLWSITMLALDVIEARFLGVIF
jgi:hypothetical protein